MLRSDEFDRVLAEVPEIARNQRFARIKALVCACNRPAPPMGLLLKKIEVAQRVANPRVHWVLSALSSVLPLGRWL